LERKPSRRAGMSASAELLVLFFSRTNVEKRPLDGFWRLTAQKTWNRARMCLF